MQHKKNNQYFNELKKFVNDNYQNDKTRTGFIKNFEAWPSSKDETWRLSRLGGLARKKISPLAFSKNENISCNKILADCYTLAFNDGAYIETLSDELPESIEINLLKTSELKTFLESIENFDMLQSLKLYFQLRLQFGLNQELIYQIQLEHQRLITYQYHLHHIL